MKKKTNKNHYNPKGYLKRFAGLDGKIRGYDKKYKTFSAKEYPAWGFELNFYTQEVEDALERIDSRFSKAMDHLEEVIEDQDKSKILKAQSVADIALFLTMQLSRTPKSKEMTSNIIDKVIQQNPLAERSSNFKLIMESYFNKDSYFQKFLFAGAQELFNTIISYEWLIIKSKDGINFITNDNVFAIGTLDLKNNKEGLGLTSSRTLKIFHLSKRLCLILTDRKGNAMFKNGDSWGVHFLDNYSQSKVTHLNGLIHSCAYKFSYFPEENLIDPIIAESNYILNKTKISIANEE